MGRLFCIWRGAVARDRSWGMTQTRTHFWLVLALWGAGLGAAAQFAKISVMFTALGVVYPSVGPGIGLMVSLVGVVGIVFGATAGVLVQRIGYRRVLVSAMVLGAVVSAYQSTLPPFALMMVSRAIEGMSHLAVVVAAPTLIAEASAKRHQALTMTLWASFFGVSFSLVAWLGLPLVEVRGPQALFAAHSVYMAVFAAILWVILPRGMVRVVPSAPLTLSGLIAQHVAIYRSDRVAAPAIGFMFYTLMYVALLTFLPQLVDPGARAFVATAMPLASIAVSLTLGVYALRYISAVTLAQTGFGCAAVLLVLLWAFADFGAVVAVLAILIAALFGLVQGASFAAIPELNANADARARAAGAVAQLGNVGTTCGTPVLALFIAGAGLHGVVLFALPLCLCGVLAHEWLKRRRARQRF